MLNEVREELGVFIKEDEVVLLVSFNTQNEENRPGMLPEEKVN